MEVFDELERRFMKQYGELKENDLVQIMMAGVRQDHSGKGESSKEQYFFAKSFETNLSL
jgi:hypothetical protein